MWKWLRWFLSGQREDSDRVIRMAEHVDRLRHDIIWLREMHSRVDEDGVPLWYVPRGIFRKQQKIMDTLNEVSHTLKDVAHVMDRLVDKVNRIDS